MCSTIQQHIWAQDPLSAHIQLAISLGEEHIRAEIAQLLKAVHIHTCDLHDGAYQDVTKYNKQRIDRTQQGARSFQNAITLKAETPYHGTNRKNSAATPHNVGCCGRAPYLSDICCCDFCISHQVSIEKPMSCQNLLLAVVALFPASEKHT